MIAARSVATVWFSSAMSFSLMVDVVAIEAGGHL
jgi:hypothetical protein